MFGSKSKAVVVEVEVPIPIKVATPLEVPTKATLATGLSQEERQAYIKSARVVKLGGSGLLKMMLEENGFEIYPFDKVADYLDKVLGCQDVSYQRWKQKWGWRGLRHSDMAQGEFNGETRDRDCFLAGPYDKEIPLPVVLTIERASKSIAIDTQLRFFISDTMKDSERAKNLDPFLAVSASDTEKLFVIERWNEPGFRM